MSSQLPAATFSLASIHPHSGPFSLSLHGAPGEGQSRPPLCSPSSSPRGGSVFIFKSSFSCPGSSTWPLPGPIVSGPRAIRSSWGRTREPPTPISSHRLGLQVPDPALGQINTSAHKRHPGTDLTAVRGSSKGGRGAGHDSQSILLRMPPGPSATPPALGCPGARVHPERSVGRAARGPCPDG